MISTVASAVSLYPSGVFKLDETDSPSSLKVLPTIRLNPFRRYSSVGPLRTRRRACFSNPLAGLRPKSTSSTFRQMAARDQASFRHLTEGVHERPGTM